MSTTTSMPYLPYQTYKSKRHSRVLSNGTITPQLEQLRQSQNASSSSVALTPRVNGSDSELRTSATTMKSVNGDVALSDNDGPTVRSASNSRPASVVIAPQQQVNGKDAPATSGQTSPSSPSAPAVAGIRINGEPLAVDAHSQAHSRSQSQFTTEPSSPSSTQPAAAAAPVVSLNDAVPAPNGKATGIAVAFPSLSLASTRNNISERAAGKAREAGPLTPTSPSSPRSSVHNPRRTSTFRYVSLRPSVNAATVPRTSSPLRPASTLGHNRTTSTTTSGFSPLSAARQLGDHPSPLQSASRSPASIHSDLTPDTPHAQTQVQTPILRPGIGISNPHAHHHHHQRSTSAQVSPNTYAVAHVNANPRIHPPERTSSLPPPQATTFVSPSFTPNSTPTPVLAPVLGSVPSASSASSSRVQSPSPIPSTPTTSTTSTVTYRAPYRPGFQPRGVIRPVTDDFLALRKHARDKERIELTRLERRFEKLVELHFSSSESDDANGSGKGKERQLGSGTETETGLRHGAGTGIGPRPRPRPMSAIYEAPALARRASSFFEELSDLKGKSASELWRSVVETRAAAANGGKGDIRAAEQRITPWQDDAEVSACPHCSASFHPLTNRKHHCRLCGRIVCSLPVKNPQRPVPCSLLFVSDPKTGQIEEVIEGVDYGVKPRARTTSTTSPLNMKGREEEEKFLKGVRICKECKPVMLRQQYRQEAKRLPIMIRLYEALISLEAEIEETLPQFQELMISLSNNPDEAPTKEASAARKHLLECFSEYDALAKRIRKIPCPGGPGSSQDRVQAAIQARVNMFLQKNMFPLQSLPKPRRRSSNNTTNENGEREGEKEVIDPDSELARALQPLLEQEALLETFVEEATRQRKFEDAKTLKGNLGEIRAEIDRIVASADGQLP